MTDRVCRECGITQTEITAGVTDINGDPMCFADDDLCSWCQEHIQRQLEVDAARYRFLRNRQTRQVDFAAGGLFAGRIPENLIIGGEDLDRAIDTELGVDISHEEPLERRLAACLSECIDAPLMTGSLGGDARIPSQICLGFFRPDIADRAAELLEEAGV